MQRLHSHNAAAPLFAAGVSLGGNALLKWLGREQARARDVIDAAGAVSAPLYLMTSGDRPASGLKRLYGLDPLYGLLLPFGLSLILEGVFRDQSGVSGPSYTVTGLLPGPTHLGLMVLHNAQPSLGVASLLLSLPPFWARGGRPGLATGPCRARVAREQAGPRRRAYARTNRAPATRSRGDTNPARSRRR